MNSPLRLILVLVVCLALPLQSIAAVAMPFCTNAGMDVHAGHGDGAATSADNHVGHGAPESPHTLSSPCDDCGLCHLACSGAVPTAASGLGDTLRSVQQPAFASVSTPFLPDPFLRPPRPSLL